MKYFDITKTNNNKYILKTVYDTGATSILAIGTKEEVLVKKQEIEKNCYCNQLDTFCDFCTGLRKLTK